MRANDKQLKVLIVEDQVAAALGIEKFLSVFTTYTFDHVVSIGEVERFLEHDPPDLLLLDLHFEEFGPTIDPGLEFLKYLKTEHPHITVLIFSSAIALEFKAVKAALQVGVSYLVKENFDNEYQLDCALRAAYSGALIYSKSTAPYIPMVDKSSKFDLTNRELEVAALVCKGFTNREVGQQLNITPAVARDTVTSILHKLDFSARAQIAAWFVENYGPCK